MWGILANLIGGPIVTGLINAYKAKLEAGNTTDRIAADLAAKEIAVEQARQQVNRDIIIAEQGRWWSALPRPLMAFAFVIYVWKVVVWDKVLGWGTTDPITGMVGDWGGIVIATYFGGRTIETVTKVVANRLRR